MGIEIGLQGVIREICQSDKTVESDQEEEIEI
jgi:hypothetical protein